MPPSALAAYVGLRGLVCSLAMDVYLLYNHLFMHHCTLSPHAAHLLSCLLVQLPHGAMLARAPTLGPLIASLAFFKCYTSCQLLSALLVHLKAAVQVHSFVETLHSQKVGQCLGVTAAHSHV